jgi:hypothetical protein
MNLPKHRHLDERSEERSAIALLRSLADFSSLRSSK